MRAAIHTAVLFARRAGKRTAAPLGRRALLLCVSCLLGFCVWLGAARADEARAFQIIVHVENPLSVAERELLADAFLKRASRWPDGEAIAPVDQKFGAPVRAQFSNVVLKRSVAAVRSYWQQRIFSGRGVPPPEVESDAAAVRYVKQHRGGVGYVSSHADTRDVKVLTLR